VKGMYKLRKNHITKIIKTPFLTLILPSAERGPWPQHEAVGGKRLLRWCGVGRGRRVGPGTSHTGLSSPKRSLVLFKDAPNNSKIF
jgi:hypothetical protein